MKKTISTFGANKFSTKSSSIDLENLENLINELDEEKTTKTKSIMCAVSNRKVLNQMLSDLKEEMSKTYKLPEENKKDSSKINKKIKTFSDAIKFFDREIKTLTEQISSLNEEIDNLHEDIHQTKWLQETIIALDLSQFEKAEKMVV